MKLGIANDFASICHSRVATEVSYGSVRVFRCNSPLGFLNEDCQR